MTIDEAVEILNDTLIGTEAFECEEQPEAIKLSIEALKRIKLHRNDRRYTLNPLLPGETEE